MIFLDEFFSWLKSFFKKDKNKDDDDDNNYPMWSINLPKPK
tara:strand:- start:2627 stop:2749 length:123 start_codon:yes stop_codon:yes gene_type:complete